MVVKINVALRVFGAINFSDWLDSVRVRGTGQQVCIMESRTEQVKTSDLWLNLEDENHWSEGTCSTGSNPFPALNLSF